MVHPPDTYNRQGWDQDPEMQFRLPLWAVAAASQARAHTGGKLDSEPEMGNKCSS